MAGVKTGVFPCYDNQFKIGESAEALNVIADMVTYSVSFSDGVEEWNPYDAEGWRRALKTAKAINIAVTGKRNLGDAGNDFVAGKALKNGRDAEAFFEWTFPTGEKVQFANAVINVTEGWAADATNVAPLVFTVMSNGKPTFVEADLG